MKYRTRSLDGSLLVSQAAPGRDRKNSDKMKIDHKIENGHDEYYAAENGVVTIGEEQTAVEKGQNISDLVEMGGLSMQDVDEN